MEFWNRIFLQALISPLALFHIILSTLPIKFVLGLDDTSPIKLEVLHVENVYRITDNYEFYIPRVNIECECVCTDKKDFIFCSDRHTACGSLSNQTTTCTFYEDTGENSKVCSKFYKVCCQAFFAKDEWLDQLMNVKAYTGIYLKYEGTLLKLQTPEYSRTILLDDNIERLIFDNVVIFLNYTDVLRLLPESWYFYDTNKRQLMFSEKMNGRGEMDWNKIGWFQWDMHREQLSEIPYSTLKRNLKVIPSDCRSNPPLFDWKLDAEFFSTSNELHKTRTDVSDVLNMYKDSVSSIMLPTSSETVKVLPKYSPRLSATLTSTAYVPFLFNSNITFYPENKAVLGLMFTKGKGLFTCIISSPHWSNRIVFEVLVHNSSRSQPVYSIQELLVKNYTSCVVCLYQMKEQLCNMPVRIRREDVTSTKHDNTTVKSVKLEINYALYFIVHAIFLINELLILTLGMNLRQMYLYIKRKLTMNWM